MKLGDKLLALLGIVIVIWVVTSSITNNYNQGYINGRRDALSEAVMCYGASVPASLQDQININYPCEE